MKRFMALVMCGVLATALVATTGCSKPPETPESARLTEIDNELKEIAGKLENMQDGDDKEKLADRRIELNAERNNIMQKANQTSK